MNRKGVTPVVATALLIGVAVSAALTASVFMQGTLSDLKSGYGDDLQQRNLEDKAELSVSYGYSRDGYLLLDLRNTGAVALPLNESGSGGLAVYVEGRPASGWSFLSDADVLSQDAIITLNTSEPFPVMGNYTKVQIRGPYKTSSTIICYNDGSPSC